MSAKDKDADSFADLFGKPVKPINKNLAEQAVPKKKPVAGRLKSTENLISQETDLIGQPEIKPVRINEPLFFARPGIQQATLRKLRRGQMVAEIELDLHGMRTFEAKPAVQKILQEAELHNIQVIRIIHGKGMGSKSGIPVLKSWINHWLREQPGVLAFCSAKPNDGGSGALYVLLKKQ